MIVYLGDLFHTWTKSGVWTIPLNIGYVASYLKKKMGDENIQVEVKLFKDANKLLDAIDSNKPDVVALGFFVWNEELNKYVFDYIKDKFPDILTVGGGPRFTNINANLEGAKKFFKKVNNCDIFIVNQGEKGFHRVCKDYFDLSFDIKKFKKKHIPGSLVNNTFEKSINIDNCENHIHVGENIGTLEDLNEIPSPYLNGMLDEFFDDRWMPVLETNRSCPYRCTFCAWGIGTQKLMKFDEERVLNEIEYIAKRCKHTPTMFIADANFAILERDAVFAKKMYEMNQKYNWPKHVAVQWNKTRPDRILKVAKEFKKIAAVGASMQTLDANVLESIKRKNLNFEQINKLLSDLKDSGIDQNAFTELILGLPNETKDSHLNGNKKLIDFGFEVNTYFLHLLPGTEMDEKSYRQKYFKKTVYRLFDNSFGIYRGNKIFEAQETVSETHSMPHKYFKYFRFFHFLMQMMWSKKWYYYFLIFLKNTKNIHPVDFISDLVDEIETTKKPINKLYLEFMSDYEEAENFSTHEELSQYWGRAKNFKRLETGDYGKLNMLYTYKVILNFKNEFSEILFDVVKKKIYSDSNISEDDDFINKTQQVLKFQNLKFLSFNSSLNIKKNVKASFEYDFLEWIKNNCKSLKAKDNDKDYLFYLTKEKEDVLNNQLKNNKSSNLNSKLRDMTVYTSTNQFFYDVKEI
tara:strand:- start:15288 stop:17354 length:2067 start_codon:yes stop_codon:yes gene_type:complete